ncbi:prolyl-tRNA synthetase, cytoplasmic [Scheffersomyces stipitis CBS 6054]|uniref:proline--tRNA ligase n=1 Tax=Scheffersomyces stipitis (strain ATCC 58785 / CBS 6054 / NBRC 10063 / NRRL Y-11545) TaxID=322104 RepID=A3M0H9_PICST|nr:prolyl-tRNA synthetase, cytoplasmic [Scheffersomyces stipitis CBS 6054]ABN68530.2 prolyl-tRNA synthetase, cytoplasmic [Scheffersomyces stipitis CBS 6054]
MLSRRFVHIKTVPRLYCNHVDTFNYSKNLPTHELLVQLNLINQPRAGLVNWSPIGLTIMNKISDIIRRRMDEISFEEVKLSLLSHHSSWRKTGRWDNSSELFKLKGEEYILSPTAEEDIVNYVSNNSSSYKNLPLLYYQINPKFRNEKRPRGGLLRGKEFMMKDAYSFDASEKDAMTTYQSVIGAYTKIFGDLKLPYTKAEADSGDIGGSLSHEWHYIDDTGEDIIYTCDGCGSVSNVEKTLSYPEQEVDESQSIEVAVRYFTTVDRSTLVCAYYPSSRTLEPKFVKNEIPDLDLDFDDQETILKEFSNEDTLISKSIVRIMDARLHSRANFPDFPISFINRSLITTFTDIPIISAIEGELCGKCEEGHLHSNKAIEVGHTFYLGDKYSKPLDCSMDFPVNEKGQVERRNLIMGCYGIGVSRIIASIGEINRDDKGLNWPQSIAPWTMTIIEGAKSESGESYESFYNTLNDNSVDYRLDNRAKIGLGKKINQSNLLGIPLAVILGKQYPIIEIEVRGKRYVEEDQLSWKKLHDSTDYSFEWRVDFDESGKDVKHFVHRDGFIAVVQALLKDM